MDASASARTGHTPGQRHEVKHSSKLVHKHQLCKHEELHESPHKLVLPQRKHSERRILLLARVANDSLTDVIVA